MDERSITVFYDGNHYTFRWLKALFAAKKTFKKRNIRICYADVGEYFPHKFNLSRLESKFNKKYDIVFLAFHHSTCDFFKYEQKIQIDFLKKVKNACKQLVWLDTADSTGNCKFEILPYVDKYLKKQFLKDKNIYTSEIWGGRYFCDYYHKKYSIDDDTISGDISCVLDEKYMHKLGLSWNVGLGDFSANGVIQYLFPFSKKRKKFIPPDCKERNYDVHFRGSSWSPVAGYQRKKCSELLSQREDLRYPNPKKKVFKIKYNQEMMRSRSVLSPFGWGEICSRDFECFMKGAALIKPDMDYLDTFPNWYIKGETYISIDWDFCDFESIMNYIKYNKEEVLLIARRGQTYYKKMMGDTGKEIFVEHLLKEIFA